MGDGRVDWILVRAAGAPEARVDLGGSAQGIGRSRDNPIVLTDGYASSRHAELVDRAGERCVRDLGSRNGTRLNGRALAPGVLHPLRDGDVIRIGSTDLTYRRGPTTNRAANGKAAAAGQAGPGHARTGQAGLGNAGSGHDGVRRPDLGHAGAGHEPAGHRAATVAPAHESLSAIFPAPPGRRRSWARARRIAVRVGLALALLACIVAVGTWALAPARVVLLVMGSDARPDELRRGEVGRTDTMLTVVADRAPAGALLISLPRDLWVPIPGYGEERINAAYALGGAPSAERTVGDVLGIPIDRYLVIGLQGVRDVVDAAGGVEIDVERPIRDDAYPTDDYGTVVVDIPAGRQRMDGETALRYARTRHQDSDFGRIARQQQVIAALRTAMLKPTNWWRAPAVLVALRRVTRTDLGLPQLVTLAVAFGGASTEPERLAIGPGLVEDFRGGDGAFLLRPTPALRQRVAAVLTPSSAAVEVLNGTRIDGLGRQAADTLRGRGMRVVNVGSAQPRPESTVEVAPGFSRAGGLAASALDLPRDVVRENPALPQGIDVRITLGENRARS